jgi:hypothetical protein
MSNPTDRPACLFLSVSVVQSGNTDVAVIDVKDVSRLCVEIVVAGQALDAFNVLARFHPSGSFQTLFSVAGDYTGVVGLLQGTSGDLTTQAVGSGWFIMDTLGIDAIKLQASSGNAAGSTVSVYAGGQ